MAEITREHRGMSLWTKVLGLIALLLLVWLVARALQRTETPAVEPVPVGMTGIAG